MPGGPVQVVLNLDRFREARLPSPGGGAGKDFYEGENERFAAHKATLLGSLRAVRLSSSGASQVNLTVQMRPDALAKSHRPFQSLFTRSRASHIGTGRYGELVFAVTPAKLAQIIVIAESGEIEVETRLVQERETPWPSRVRTELSAIESLRAWNPAEERGFTLANAEEWLTSDGSAKVSVQLFDLPGRDLEDYAKHEIQAVRGIAAESSALFRIASSNTDEVEASQETNPRTGLGVTDISNFRESLAALEASSAVMRVRLDDRLAGNVHDVHPESGEAYAPPGEPTSTLPVVGIIDGGVGGIFDSSKYVAGRSNFLASKHRNIGHVDHATKIASIVALGSGINPGLLSPSEDCHIYDLDLIPDQAFLDSYYGSLDDFLDEVRSGVARAKETTGARVFNLSYNLRRAPGGTPYSVIANGLDRIALDLDVIFVISAGNLEEIEERPEWPVAPTAAMAMLAVDPNDDGLGAPAESIANVSVGAINPTGMPQHIAGVPARYTRRSIQVPSAVKPDFAAPGGASPSTGTRLTGLRALDASTGSVVQVKGTSFAAPIVARYLATLNSAIAGNVSRELLLALAVHHAAVPDPMRASELSGVAPSFVGHGILPSVADTLDGDAHRVTIVLSDTIKPGRRVEFPFTWPDSLSSAAGNCRGILRLTLLTEPVIDPAHGWEMVRLNLDGAVKQADRNGRFRQRSQPTHEFFSGYRYATEKTLASVLGKWYPVKTYSRRMPRGVGASTDWRIDIDYLTRAAEVLPDEGIRFAAVFTIEDLDREAPVFDEMRASLSTIGVTLSDLRTAVNIGIRA